MDGAAVASMYEQLSESGRDGAFQMFMGCVAIIDDSADTLELFAFVLQDYHRVSTYSTTQAFFEEFSCGSFNLILLDLVMPDGDGFQTYDRIRKHDARVPVIAVTAGAMRRERDKALRVGFCEYFTKPVMEINQFREAICKHVR